MTKLKINYPDHVEAVDAVPHGDHWRLTRHSYFMPLAPGDIVAADEDRNITGVVEQRDDLFVVEAYFPIETKPEAVRAKAEEWRRATDVTQPTALTVMVSSTSHKWITDEVEPHATFDLQIIRTPGQTIDFDVRRARA
jgi:hypothetical protein